MKHLIAAILLAVLSSSAFAQTTPAQEETVEGFGNVLGYFGRKLGKELGTRLNLDNGEDADSTQMVPTKVLVKFGPFTVEKNELRPRHKAKTEQ